MSAALQEAEWLEADGLGGFASGTVAGPRTRRYHALLLAATTPPTGRVVLVNGLEVWIETEAGRFALSAQRYAPDVVHPDGHTRIGDFGWEPWPRWIFRAEDGTEVSREILTGHDRTEAGAALCCRMWISGGAPQARGHRPQRAHPRGVGGR